MKRKIKLRLAKVATVFCCFAGSLSAQSSIDANNASILGTNNSAFGKNALLNAAAGSNQNTAIGYLALYTLTTGDANTAAGYEALYYCTGDANTAAGDIALMGNTTGNSNTAFGHEALVGNQTGIENSAFGASAMIANLTGDGNTAVGFSSGTAGTAENHQTAIGARALTHMDDMIRLGGPQVTLYECQVAMLPPSDQRFKSDVNYDGVNGLEFIQKLRPVVYNLDTKKHTEINTHNFPEKMKADFLKEDFSASMAIRRTGFIAQEVEEAANAVGYNFSAVSRPGSESGVYGLQYEIFVVPLTKAIQEQQALIKQYQKELLELKNEQSNIRFDSHETKIVQTDFSNSEKLKFIITQITAGKNYMLGVFELSGKEIKSELLIPEKGSFEFTINRPSNSGLYYCKIISEGEVLATLPFVNK